MVVGFLPRQRLIRRVLIFAPFVGLLVFLLWPLASRRWDIDFDEAMAGAKADYLRGQRSAVRTSGPRIILILVDDLGLTDIGLYGGTMVATPNIDSIGHDGVTFTNASCTTAICAPSRASLLTGRYQQRFGFELQPHDRYPTNRLEYLAFRYFIDTNHMVPVPPGPTPSASARDDQGIPPSEIMISEVLQARGFETAAIGKWHLGYSEQFSPLARGFDGHFGFYEAFSLYAAVDDPGIIHTPIDDFSDRHMWSRGRDGASAIVRNDVIQTENQYLTFKFADLASDYIREHAEEPFFLYLPFNAPHTPLQAPVAYWNELDHIDDPVRRTYFAMIAALDDAVGEILGAVKEAGIAEDTLLVFASDNGGASYLGVTDNEPLAGGKFSTFEGGLAVPLMFRYPSRITPGTTIEEPVTLMDIFATIEAITRVPSEPPIDEVTTNRTYDGVDLLPFIDGTLSGSPHQTLFWRSNYNKAVRSGYWKLVVEDPSGPTGGQAEGVTLLFNLAADPSETCNLAAEHPDLVVELLCTLRQWEDEMARPSWPPVMDFWMEVWGDRYWFSI